MRKKTLLLTIQRRRDVERVRRILTGQEATSGEVRIQFAYCGKWDTSTSDSYFNVAQVEEYVGTKGDEAVFNVLAACIEDSTVHNIHVSFCFCNLSEPALLRLAEAVERSTCLYGFSEMRNPGNCPEEILDSANNAVGLIWSSLFAIRIRQAIIVTKSPIRIWNEYPLDSKLKNARIIWGLCLALVRRSSLGIQYILPSDILRRIRDAL